MPRTQQTSGSCPLAYDAAMPLFARYILRQLTGPTLLALVAFSGAVWVSQSLRFVDLIVNKGLSVGRFLYLTALLVPSLVDRKSVV